MEKPKKSLQCIVDKCRNPRASNAPNSRYCWEHRNTTNRAADLRRAAARGETAAADELARLGRPPASPTESNPVSDLQRYAVLLGQCGGRTVDAARLAGLHLVGDALEAYAARAREECPDFVSGKQSAATSVANAAVLLTLIRIRDSVGVIPVASLGSTLRQLGDVLDRLQGGLSPVYSEVAVEIRLDQPEPRGPVIDVEVAS